MKKPFAILEPGQNRLIESIDFQVSFCLCLADRNSTIQSNCARDPANQFFNSSPCCSLRRSTDFFFFLALPPREDFSRNRAF